MRNGGFWGALAAAVALSLVLACSPSSRYNGAAVTLTGCLQPGDSPGTFLLTSTGQPNSTVGTSGSRQGAAGQNNPTGTSAESNSSDIGAATTKMYTLVPGQYVDLGKNQGSLVRITGRLGQSATGTTSGSSDRNVNPANPQGRATQSPAGQGRSVQGQQGGEQQPPPTNKATGQGPQSSTLREPANRPVETIHVDSVRRVARTCSGGN